MIILSGAGGGGGVNGIFLRFWGKNDIKQYNNHLMGARGDITTNYDDYSGNPKIVNNKNSHN